MATTNNASIATDLFNYIISNVEFKENTLKQFGIQSAIVDNSGKKRVYGFVGMGCGITYLRVDGRSKKSVMFKDLVYDVHRRVNNYIYNEWFTDEQKEYFENFGCPVSAVLHQDQQCQIEFYHLAVKFAKEVLGIKKIYYVSNLD